MGLYTWISLCHYAALFLEGDRPPVVDLFPLERVTSMS